MPRQKQIGARIKYVSENLAPTKTAFAEKFGESPKVLNAWIVRGANKRNLERILATYPVINREWLFSGYGLPFNDNPEPEETPTREESPSISSVVTHQQKIDESIDMGTASLSMASTEEKTISSGETNRLINIIEQLTKIIESQNTKISELEKLLFDKNKEITA